MSSKLMICAILLSLAVTASAVADTIMIDDFSSELSSNWEPSILKTSTGATGTITYDTTTNPGELTATMTGFSPTQVLGGLLRDDYSLGVGDTLLTDYISNSTLGTSNVNGLLIATATGITSRTNIIYLGYSSIYSRLEGYCFNNAGGFTSLLTGNGSVAVGTLAALSISQPSAGVYALSYSLTSDPTSFLPVATGTFTVSGEGNLNPGNAIGYMFDPRANGNVVFDNFRMDVVPEPSTLALLACGLLGLLAYAWRKRK